MRGDSAQTQKRLAEAARTLAAGRAADAADELQRLLDEAGDDLVSDDGRHFRAARYAVHGLLAQLPADALATYRDRIDAPARLLLDAAKRDRDPRPLWALLDRFFVSKPAQEALALLGDLLFEQGELRAAETVWRRLLPDEQPDLAYPAAGDATAVRARLVLAAIFQGERDRATTMLDAFCMKHPDAAGPLAGTTGPYAATLQRLLAHPPTFPTDHRGSATWPTFGGNPGRDGRAAGRVPKFWPSRPTFSVTLPLSRSAYRVERVPVAARPPFGHPVVADGRAYVTDGFRLFAVDLASGALHTMLLDNAPPADANDPDARPAPAATSLTATAGRVYARLGPAEMKAGAETALACLVPVERPAANRNPLVERWRLAPPAIDGKGPGVWEGTPLVAGRRLWAALARFEGGRVVHSLAAYDPADADERPEPPAWLTEVCDSPLPRPPETRTRGELLTHAGRYVVFSSNDGAVVAVDAVNGRKTWAFRYQRVREPAGAADPAPAVCFGGRVFVAPTDADRVFALDTETGRTLWESGPCEGAALLGVARDRLIVTAAGGIRALDLRTGSHREPEGWVQARPGVPAGYGRGFATDDAVAWPTRAGLFFLDPDSGEPLAPPLQPHRSPRDGTRPRDSLGNVVYADGCLVAVVHALEDGVVRDQVWVYRNR